MTIKLNKKFHDYAIHQRTHLDVFKKDLIRMKRNLEQGDLKEHEERGLWQLMNFAKRHNICTYDEITVAYASGNDQWTKSVHERLCYAVKENPRGIVEFLYGRANKAICIVNNAKRYNPSLKDETPNGFLGWRQFAVA